MNRIEKRGSKRDKEERGSGKKLCEKERKKSGQEDPNVIYMCVNGQRPETELLSRIHFLSETEKFDTLCSSTFFTDKKILHPIYGYRLLSAQRS